MSRTDKDTPWWIADEYKPHHSFGCSYWGYSTKECDLPEIPVKPRHTRCYWYPTFEAVLANTSYRKWSYGKSAPPRWFNRHVWYGPERRKERTILGEARKDYNANGDTEIETVNMNHRHNGQWLW